MWDATAKFKFCQYFLKLGLGPNHRKDRQYSGYMVYPLKSFPFYRADCSTTNVSRLENVTRRSTCDLSRNQRIGIYAGTTAAAILINFARTIAFYFICVNASRVLHNRMFAAVLRAPVLFFDTNPIGEQVSVFLSVWLSVVCLSIHSSVHLSVFSLTPSLSPLQAES